MTFRVCCLLGILVYSTNSGLVNTGFAQAPDQSETSSGSFSALPLISGFDAERLAKCAPITDTRVAGEMARLLYRLKKASQQSWPSELPSLVIDERTPLRSRPLGDVLSVDGKVSLIRQYKVPIELVEFLDLTVYHEVLLDLPGGRTVSLFAPPVKGSIAKGDRIAASGVLIRPGSGTPAEQAPILAAGRLSWFPSQTQREGWKLLSLVGMDLSLIAEAPALNRRRLQAADSDAFYGLLAATKQLKDRDGKDRGDAAGKLPLPKTIEPLDLLTKPKQYHGEWIQMDLSTVRVTRVLVNDAERQKQIGQDHYFQIDTSGDLGKTIVELAREAGDEGAPIQMSGSYPVTLVATNLPPFLVRAMGDETAVVSMVDQPVQIHGFFYRLWSYENEFMSKREAGKQVGPLVAVANWKSTKQADSESENVAVLGYAMAFGLVVTILSVFFWSTRNAKQDALIREKQREQQRIDVPIDTST